MKDLVTSQLWIWYLRVINKIRNKNKHETDAKNKNGMKFNRNHKKKYLKVKIKS